MFFIADIEPICVDVEAVGVLHKKLAHAQDAALGSGLIAEFDLDLVPDLRELTVRA